MKKHFDHPSYCLGTILVPLEVLQMDYYVIKYDSLHRMTPKIGYPQMSSRVFVYEI